MSADDVVSESAAKSICANKADAEILNTCGTNNHEKSVTTQRGITNTQSMAEASV
jgi:hypothetical protein